MNPLLSLVHDQDTDSNFRLLTYLYTTYNPNTHDINLNLKWEIEGDHGDSSGTELLGVSLYDWETNPKKVRDEIYAVFEEIITPGSQETRGAYFGVLKRYQNKPTRRAQ